MNDRYLYRAKRTDNGDWVEGFYLFCPIQDNNKSAVENFAYKHWIVTHNGKVYKVDPSTICQCTGLKDKNGKLIWENDVVRYTDMITGAEKIDRIEWNETHASFARLHRSQMGLQYLNIDEYIANGCDVIGNVFDNPELLE